MCSSTCVASAVEQSSSCVYTRSASSAPAGSLVARRCIHLPFQAFYFRPLPVQRNFYPQSIQIPVRLRFTSKTVPVLFRLFATGARGQEEEWQTALKMHAPDERGKFDCRQADPRSCACKSADRMNLYTSWQLSPRAASQSRAIQLYLLLDRRGENADDATIGLLKIYRTVYLLSEA